ncbi:MAG: hypothetical protein KKC51_12045, partial [Verrucomicrobia bacterium]|nr:hypothetical protein [Verrucomicrobiota bacterium]
KSGGDPLAFHPLSALLFLPFSFPPRNGAASARARRRNAVAAETASLQSVLRTDAAAHKTERQQRFLNGNAVRLTAPLALLNIALNAALSTPAAFQVPVSPASFTPRKGENAFSLVHLHRQNPSLQMRPQKPPGNSPRVFVYAKASGPFANVRR